MSSWSSCDSLLPIRTLNHQGLTHHGKITVALKGAVSPMREIDKLIPSWPVE